MQVTQDPGARPIKNWAIGIEDQALAQAKNLARLPFIAANGVALMPDAHAGKGSTVGSVIATEKAIIPAAVGVDIGCGMNAVRISLKAHQLPDSLASLRAAIEAAVPTGFEQHSGPVDRQLFQPAPGGVLSALESRGDWIQKAARQMGTLGGGNHFIELCIDENDDVWVMLHSGSRGVGNMIGTHFIEKAKETMEAHFIKLEDPDLSYIPEATAMFKEYIDAVGWAQNYALANRAEMMRQVLRVLAVGLPEFTITQEAINCHHNYVERENHFGRNMWITRKGAIRARDGDLGIIPGSMGQKSFIVRGKGSTESYCSCSHGAGRKMSRAAARKLFTTLDLERQTEGVECRKDDAVLDEIPSSYKSIDEVMAAQSDLVDVVHTLRAVLCVKGG